MSRRLFAAVAVVALVAPVRAEKVPLSPEELLKTATHVVTGKVLAVYSRTATEGDWKYTRYVAEVRVDECAKGDGVKKDELVYARYWQRTWVGIGQMPPNTVGHSGRPAAGDTVRVYLAKNAYDGFTQDNKDNGFNVIGANGFEAVKPVSDK